jgi:hypothetical protein
MKLSTPLKLSEHNFSQRCDDEIHTRQPDPRDAIGAIGRNLTAMLLAKGHKVRALVRREDERADALRRLAAEVCRAT